MAPLGWGCVNYVSCVRVTLTENTSIYAPIPQTYFTLTLNPDLPSAKATVNLILWKFFLKKKKMRYTCFLSSGLPGLKLPYFSHEGTPLIISFKFPLKMQKFGESKWVRFFKRLLIKQCSSTLANLYWFHPKLIMKTEWYVLQPASFYNTGVGQSHTA